ncbi:MAG: DUF2332 family protein [Antricoccus sp.]
MSAEDLATIFKASARAQRRSRINAALLRGMAGDLEAGGLMVALLKDITDGAASDGQLLLTAELPARLTTAVHAVALRGQNPIAEVYPSVGGHGALHEVWPVARAVMTEQPTLFASIALQPNRRSEPARAAMLWAALAYLGAQHSEPVRLFDVGSGAGLVLAFDSYQQQIFGEQIGDPQSPVDLGHVWRTPPDVDFAAVPPIVNRRACDALPGNPANPQYVRELVAYLAPDVPEQIARLTAACQYVAHQQLQVDKSLASTWLPRGISWPRADAQSVIWHSDLVLSMTVPERTEFASQLLAAASRATDTAPFTTISFEPVGADVLLYQDPVGAAVRSGELQINPNEYELRINRWPEATSTVLASAEPNGESASWLLSAPA